MSVIAVDVGGTTIKAAVYEPGTQRVGPVHVEATGHGDTLLGSIIAAIRAAAGDSRISAIGICAPGIVNRDTGVIALAGNLGITDYPLRDLLRAEFGVPIILDHDLRTGAHAEAQLGHGKEASNFVYVAIGTGLALSVVIDGQVLCLDPWAGEIGQISYPSPHIGPTAYAALENIAAAGGICSRVMHLAEPTGQIPGRVVMSVEELNYSTIYQAFSTWGAATHHSMGEELLLSFGGKSEVNIRDIDGIVRDQINALAQLVANIAGILGPVDIVLGGGVAQAGEKFREAILESAKSYYLRIMPAPKLVPAVLGAGAQLLGAGLLGASVAKLPPN
ncbi:MAG: ROK family protein [Corynebacterium sp.]|nr:ROK family protein [Corynebacterium sp.]